MRRIGLWTAALAVLVLAACGDGTGVDTPDPASLVKLDGDGQSGPENSALPESLVVQVLDANGGGVPGVTVSWALITGGGTVAPAAQRTDTAGRLAAAWTVGPAGPQVLQAGAAGFSVTFNAVATSPPPPSPGLALVVQPSLGQSGVTFATQPSLQLEDALGAPLAQAGVTITAAIASGSNFASLDGITTATTSAAGVAVFTDLGLTGPVGDYTLRFTAAGFTEATSGTVALSTVSGRVPLTDMGGQLYHTFEGGLYPGGNVMPSAHATAGAARARNVVPRGVNGNPNAGGQIVLMSIGMSNTTQEWCDIANSVPCNSWSFTGQAAADNAVEHSRLRVVDGAKSSQTAQDWTSPASPNYDRIRDSVLAPLGLTEAQVQVIWLKVANPDPAVALPAPNADAIVLLEAMGDIVRTLAARYPSLQIVFVSSRSYGGYANNSTLNPEPYAYESGFAVKWLIQAQIAQMANGGTVVDARAGDLDYNSAAPWLAWGAYLWADGTNPRSDGLTYLASDFESDGTHPATSGETKIGGLLLSFFKTDPRAACWFLAGASCP